MHLISQTLILLSWLVYNIIKAHNLRDQCESNLVVPDGMEYQSRRQKVVNEMEYTTYVVKESNTKLSSRRDIIKKDRMLATYDHELIFRIQQNNEDRIEEILKDVSDPNSANYGQHLSQEEVSAITDNPVSREFTLTYLAAVGATVIAETLSGEYLTARASIRVWEELLDTEFYEFHYRESDSASTKKIVRAETYSVPISLNNHVASIFNTIQMPTKIYAKPIITRIPDEKLNSTSSIQAKNAAGFINPAILKERYAVGSALGSEQATQAAYETIGQYFSPADLKMFQSTFMLEEEPIAFDIGGHSSDSVCVTSPSSCVEANLDIQYLMAISSRSPTTHWYTNSNSFAAFLVAVANIERPPLVISISYGADEGDMSRSEFDAFNFQAMKLGVMGVTILAASGGNDGFNLSALSYLYFRICMTLIYILLQMMVHQVLWQEVTQISVDICLFFQQAVLM